MRRLVDANVVCDGLVEEKRLLKDGGDQGCKRLVADVPDIVPTDGDRTAVLLPEAHEELQAGGLAAAV